MAVTNFSETSRFCRRESTKRSRYLKTERTLSYKLKIHKRLLALCNCSLGRQPVRGGRLLVSLLVFSSVWSDCVNRWSKRARVWSTSEWYAFTPVNTDRFPMPVGGRINRFHRSLFCNCCCCLFFLSSRNSSPWWLNKGKKPCLATKIFQWSMTTQMSSKSEWLTHRARYRTVVRPFFRATYSLWYGGTPKPRLRQRLNEIKISFDRRLAGFLSTAFYNLQAFSCCQSATASLSHSKTAWSQVTLFKPPILHDTIFLIFFIFHFQFL